MTEAEAIRLSLLARAAERLAPASTVTREPSVKPKEFDTIEEHVGGVYRYALRLTRDRDRADDLAQETVLRAWRDRDRLREPRAARVWLLRIATNLWNDELRRAKFRMETLFEEPPCGRAIAPAASDERESVRVALAAMDELPARQRQVLYLATCEEMTTSEVAEVLEISEPAVKANLSLARKAMRRRLKDLYEEVCGRRPCNRA
ncbi:MAG: RNA polymerase sigma factor [Pirellulales bacterium]